MRLLMTVNLIILLLLMGNQINASEGVGKDKKDDFRILVAQFPKQEFIDICQPKSGNRKKVDNDMFYDNLCRTVKRNLELVEDIRTRVKLGSNVFEYPGLISIGNIGYHAIDDNSYVYVVRIPGSLELTGKVLLIGFDENGVVTFNKINNSSKEGIDRRATILTIDAEGGNQLGQDTTPNIQAKQCPAPLKQCRLGVSSWCCNSGKSCDYDTGGCK